MSNQSKGSITGGIILLLIGTLFLLHNLGVNVHVWDFLGTYWPLILVVIGVKNIFLYLQKKP
ncbi:MAG TPA: DUF5668 domain-containing protein [Candidatus Aminicenantes bacterium]|mgnify:CR=1 FL=1|nr:DUF5668 domain-containing protein [Candidatus Aminicenantes bacterium]